MTTYTADWYDVAMVEEGSPAMLPIEDSPWLEMYRVLADMIAPHEEVVDLGCGTGRFIEFLHRAGHRGRISGVDWSQAALEEAKRYQSRVAILIQQDLAEWTPDPERAGNTTYVCAEVLEHLEDDLALVRAIPPGHRLLLTVPNFSSESHLRIFPTVGAVWERYAPELVFKSWRMVGTERKGIHVLETVRRKDSW